MASNSINDLKAIISTRGGLAASNRFLVEINLPSGVGVLFPDHPTDLNLLCESVNMPGRLINTEDYQSVAQSFKVANGFVNEDVTFTFHLTNDFFAKKVFEAWADKIIDFERYRLHYSPTYRTSIKIWQLDKAGKKVQGVELAEAYPITLNGINLDDNAENTTQKYTVTVTYKNYISLNPITTPIGDFTLNPKIIGLA